MSYKMKNKFMAVIVVLLLAVMVIPITPDCSFAQTKVFKWRMPSFLPRGTSAEKVREQWCKDLNIASGGRIVIEYFGAGEILPPLEMWDAVAKGAIDIAFSYGAYWIGKTPIATYSEGWPFTAPDLTDFSALLYEFGMENVIRKGYAEHNIHLLRTIPCIYTVWLGKRPFTTAADLKGRKNRAGGPIAEMLKAGGVPTVYVPTPEIYSALERGTIDNTLAGPVSYMYDMKFHEVVKYIMIPGSGPEADEIIMNLKTWEKLPEDLKMLLYQSCAELGEKISANYWGRDRACLKEMVDKWGVKVTPMPESERKIMSGWTLKAAEGLAKKDRHCAEAYEILKKYLIMLGRL